MEEYGSIEAAFYDHYSTGVEGDEPFYLQQARDAGAPVLELGCGTGRILIPIAQAGVEIVGVDRSPAMLDVARHKIDVLDEAARRRIELVEGDMSDFALTRSFNLVMIPYRAFLHLITPEDQRRALGCIHRHLADGGRLVLNVFDPLLDVIADHFSSLGSAAKHIAEFTHPETDRRVIVSDTRRHDLQRQLIEMYFIFEELDEDGRVVAKHYSPLRLRWVYRHEMQYLLELCGFEVEALYGDFDGGEFEYGGEQVWIARKR